MIATLREADDHVATLASYVPHLVASWQPPGEGPGWTEIDGTLLSADISGFTALSERLAGLGREGAEELTNILNDCFAQMIEAVHVQFGDIIKFGGDALLILFSGADHAARACRAAVDMRSIVARPLVGVTAGRVQLAISQGMHSGRFTIYSVRAGHTDLVITGRGATETVDCESMAEPGQILLSSATAALLPTGLTGEALSHDRRLLTGAPELTEVVDDPATHRADADPARYIPDAQREQILVGAPAEHRRVSVAFVKFSHTDHLEDDGPDVVARHLQRLVSIVAGAVVESGVHWMATDIVADGGKIILAAGAPTASADDEDRMLRAVRTIAEQTSDFDVRIGVNCGAVFVGDLGSPRRRTFTIMGDAVNLAARLMAKAHTGQVVASQAITDRARTRYHLDELEPFFVKGKTEAISASLLGRLEGRDAGIRNELPLVGRDGELAMLERVVQGARAGHGGVVEVAGDAGTGKTRLIDEVRARAGLPQTTVICGQYAKSSPYFVLRLLLRTLSGSALVTPADEAGAALTEWVRRVAPDQLPWLPLVALVADAAVDPTDEADRIAPAFRRERTHHAVADLLTAAVRAPSLLVIEDVHWIDDASRDALGTVFEDIAERPWAVLLTRRPDAPIFAAMPPDVHTVMDLQPLDATAALELAASAAGEDQALRPDDWDRLVERSGGNPLFVIELVMSAAQQHGDGDSLPDSIEALVTSRLDELRPADRLLLREASVLGTVIDSDILATTLGDDAVRSPARWRDLDVFVTSISGVLQFRHGLHRQVAYEGMSYRRRREAHRRVGEAIEARAGDRYDEWAELLSTHFDAAGTRDRAWRYSRIAGDRSRAKNANVEAAEFYRRALDNGRAVRVPKPELIEVAEALGDVSELAGHYEDAARAYRRAAGLKVEGIDRVRLMHKEGVLRERIGRYTEALRWYRRGLNLLEREEFSALVAALRAKLALAYAGVRYRQGRYGDLMRWAGDAVDNAELAGDRASLAHAYYLLDLGAFSLGRDDVHYRELALPIYEDLRDDVGLCNVWNNLGIVDYHAGQWSKALESYSIACRAAERAGDVVGVATGENNIGEILCDQGRIDEAVPMFRKALRVFRSAGYPAGIGVATANLGWVEVLAGEVEQGMAHLERAVTVFDELGASAFVFMTRVRMVEALVARGQCATAVDLANSVAGRLSDEGDDKPKVQLQRARSWALLALGSPDEAARLIDDAAARAGDARYERGCNDLCRANIALVNGRTEEAAELQRRAEAILDELGVVSLPRLPWRRPPAPHCV